MMTFLLTFACKCSFLVLSFFLSAASIAPPYLKTILTINMRDYLGGGDCLSPPWPYIHYCIYKLLQSWLIETEGNMGAMICLDQGGMLFEIWHVQNMQKQYC